MNSASNLSITENIIRLFLGLFLAVFGGFLGYYVATPFYALVALSPLAFITAILAWCPLYTLLGINRNVNC